MTRYNVFVSEGNDEYTYLDSVSASSARRAIDKVAADTNPEGMFMGSSAAVNELGQERFDFMAVPKNNTHMEERHVADMDHTE